MRLLNPGTDSGTLQGCDRLFQPLSEYTRYEFEVAYPGNAAAGEQI